MKVLFVADLSPVVVQGGGERALDAMARGLAARGHAVRVVARAPEGVAPSVAHAGVPVRHFAVDRGSLAGFVRSSVAGAARAVRAELAAGGADVLHLQQPLSALGALAAARDRALPSLYTFHSPAPLEYRLRRGTTRLHRRGAAGWAAVALLWAAERTVLRRVARVHVLSDFSAGLLRRIYGIGPERVVRIPGGVDLERFRPVADRAALRRALGLPVDRPVLFTLRNLEPRMGLDALLAAVAQLDPARADCLLLVGGAGPLRDALERQARALGLGGRVRFLGFVPDDVLPAYYAAADAFVLPTRALEGFGLVTVEALATGTPVLGTPVGATPENLAPLDPTLLFEAATPAAIARGLAGFLERLADPAGVARLREACRRHAERHYGWPRAVAALEAVLARLAREGHGPGPCPVCGATAARPFVHDGRRYAVCGRCGTGVLAAPPGPAVLRQVYECEYPRRFAPDRCAPPRATLLAELLAALPAPAPGDRLVDVGCGGGHLLAAARARGWRGLGTDLGLVACVSARGAGPVVQADAGALPLRAGTARVVTLVNVLDHLPDPARALAEARRVLAPGGTLLLRVPNGPVQRAAARWLRGALGRWTGLGRYPVLHLFSLSPAALRRLVARAGFEVLAVRNSALVGDGAPGARGLLGAGRRAWATLARALAAVSGGRWLVAPSVELLAQAPAPGATGPAACGAPPADAPAAGAGGAAGAEAAAR